MDADEPAFLLQGDCVEKMKDMHDESVDLTVTSPPYDNLRTYNGNISQWNDQKWRDIIFELFRVTKKGGIVVWVVGDATVRGSETGTSFKQALWAKECGFNLHDTMIFQKLNVPPSVNFLHNRYEQEWEYIFILSKGKPKTFNVIRIPKVYEEKRKFANGHRKKDGSFTVKPFSSNKDKVKRNIWSYVTSGGSSQKIASKHPAIFPEKLARDQVISWSNEGDIVLDPMMGSGTVGVVCKNLNRKFIGIELDSVYFELAQKRIEQ